MRDRGGILHQNQKMIEYYYISLSFATFSIKITDGIVTFAPPIAKWCVGKSKDVVIKYYKSCDAVIEEMD